VGIDFGEAALKVSVSAGLYWGKGIFGGDKSFGTENLSEGHVDGV